MRSWIFPVACLGCGRAGVALCAACLPAPSATRALEAGGVSVVALTTYDGVLRDAIVAMKRGERAYLDAFAPVLAPLVAPGAVLVPLPTTRARRAARGFDQAVELAERVARLSGARCVHVLAKRGAPQRGLGRAARMRAGARFRVSEVPALDDVTLLDDVCTTGATIGDAAAALRACGVSVRGALVIAWTPPGRNHRSGDVVVSDDHPTHRGALR